MKRLRTRVVGGVLAFAGVIGAALINYFVENGTLPAWLTRGLNWVKDVLTLTTPWAVWELLLPILFIGGVSIILLYIEAEKISKQRDLIDALTNELQSTKSRFKELEKTHNNLKAMHDGIAESHANLELSNSELIVTNAELMNKIASLPKTGKPDKLITSNLNQEQLSVFEFIGNCLDSGRNVYVDTVIRGLRLSLLTTEDILDALCDLKFLDRYDSIVEPENFVLTPAGRSCYLELKRSISIKPATRHG